MASRFAAEHLIIPTENFVFQNKKEADGKTKSLKTATRKGGTGLGGRRALNDITNKSSHRYEASSQKKNEPKEEFNVAEEMFLHDHKKCIEAQKHATNNTFYLDMVLPGHDSINTAHHQVSKKAKRDPDSPRCYPEAVELPMAEFADWSSPPCSPTVELPMPWDSPPSSLFVWESEAVEFALKED